MSRVCEFCGKGPTMGNNISHANNKTRKRWNANIQTVKADVNGRIKRVKACTRCIRSGVVNKVAR